MAAVMRRAPALLLPLALLAAPAPARDALGVFGQWGAFRDPARPRCYAIAEPRKGRPGAWPAFAAVSVWPAEGVRGQLHVRLSHARDPAAPVTLTIGPARTTLIAGRADAWAAGPRLDAAVVAAMRSGEAMVVASRDAMGHRFTDIYPLKGAATAIDAAALACARER